MKCSRRLSPSSATTAWSDSGTLRTRCDFGVSSSVGAGGQVAPDVQDAVREVDVPPAQREQLALPQPGERRDREQRRELLVRGRARDGVHLLDVEHVELVAARHGDLLRVRRTGSS